MNYIYEKEDNTNITIVKKAVDQFPCVQSSPECNSNSIYSSKRTSTKNNRSKYQSINRPTSLPPMRSSLSFNENVDNDVEQHQHYISDSNNNNNNNTPSSLLVTSFLQYLRHELRAATNDKKNDYHRHTKQKSSKNMDSFTPITSKTKLMNLKLSHENLLELNNQNEILTLIDLLVLRVECLSNEKKLKKQKKKKKKKSLSENKSDYPTVTEIDQNLIEYLYYLFTKFLNDDSDLLSNDLTSPVIDKNNFVNVCQALVRNGCFDISSTTASTVSEKSFSEITTTSTDDTLTHQTFVREYDPDIDKMIEENLLTNQQNLSVTSMQQDTWLVVDLEPTQSDENIAASEVNCLLPTSISDEQLLLINDNCKSESSHSIYFSPNSSLIDIQNMVQDLDDTYNNCNASFSEDGSSSNVMIETKTTIFNDDIQSSSITSNNICTRLTNDHDNDDDDSLKETSEQLIINNTDKMSQREKRMHERWSIPTKINNNEQSSTTTTTKTLLDVEFPPIAVLRRKFSSSTHKKKNKNKNSTATIQEINTSPVTMIVDKTNPDQIVELTSKDASVLISTDDGENNDNGQQQEIVSEFICLSDQNITMRKKEGLLLSPKECQIETTTTTNANNDLVDDQHASNKNTLVITTDPYDSNTLSSSSRLETISSSCLTLTTNENKNIEPLLKEKEEEKKEVQRCDDDYNVDEEKKNNSSFVHDYHASGIILINDEPTQTVLVKQEKKEKEKEEEEKEKERPSSPLPTLEQFNQQRTEDESPIQTLSNNLNKMAMTNINESDELYKKVEIEEVPDDEEATSTKSIDSIEPTDYIYTDDERKKPTQSSSPQTNITTIKDDPVKFDNVLSCYEKALAQVVDTYDDSSESINTLSKESSKTNQQHAHDPIALRALQRFEERMNAAVKTNKDDKPSLTAKGKSSWSGSLSSSRKSLENLFKSNEQQLRPTQVSIDGETTKEMSTSQSDSFIQPRRTFDDNSLNYGLTFNLVGTTSSTMDKIDKDIHKPEEQQQPSATVESDDKRVIDNNSISIVNSKEQQQIGDNLTMTSISQVENETDNSKSLIPVSTDNSLIRSLSNTVISQSSSNEQSNITPYHFQLEGRRRLNTLERMRERQKSRESFDVVDQQQQQQFQNDYTLKPEEVQDPIIRRALERFDENNRKLTQSKSMNYDEIQDPITRRALMRLETNLKRTMPSSTTPNDSNETWYTENYLLGSLQPTNDRPTRSMDSSQLSTINNKTKQVSVHQRYCAPLSNDNTVDLTTTNNRISTIDNDIPVMRVPTQPIYVTSNNQLQQQQQQQQPSTFSLRQRSRSEDKLSSKDLAIGQTTNLDEIDTSSQLQRNRSSNEIALTQPGFQLTNTIIKSLEPTFVRTTESSHSYTTPTQTYSAYSCEYTRPRRNPLIQTPQTSTIQNQEINQLLPPKYPQQQNEIQRSTIDNQSSSNFTPIQSSTTPITTNTYYNQQPLPTPSYGTMYTSNNSNSSSSFSEDPIVRRALERFNSQMQSSLLSSSQYNPTNHYLSQQGNFSDPWMNSNRSTLMTTSTSSNSSNGGYQSIIGRRRQTRHDETNNFLIDNPSVGDGYTSSVFTNTQNPYTPTTTTNHYMNTFDQPPIIPPRFRRNDDFNEQYRRHSTDEFLSENTNNNNNNNLSHTLPRDAFIHHAYPATISNATNFRPTNIHYNQQQFDSYNQFSQEQDELHDQGKTLSNNNPLDNIEQQQQQQHRSVRTNNIQTTQINNQQRLPPSSISVQTNTQQNGRKTNEEIITSDNLQSPSGQTILNQGNISGDAVFHRLAYTGTKASLSKTSSNSCSNLLNKNSTQNQLKSCDIDFDDSSNPIIEQNNNNNINNNNNNNIDQQMSTSTNKYQRSKSADGRSRLKFIQSRPIDNDENNISLYDERQRTIVSSKFTPINNRRDVELPRIPLTPTATHRITLTKRPSGEINNFSYTKTINEIRTQNSNDINHQQKDMENNNNYEPRIIDHRPRTAIPVQRYPINNNLQSSASTSSVNSNVSRTKPLITTTISLDRRDSNTSNSEPNRTPRRTDDNRFVSPGGQRRNVPVSVFSPAILDNKRPAPAPPTFNYESQQETTYSSRLSTNDSSYPTNINEHEMNNRITSTNSGFKSSTGNLMNEFSFTTDKHDHNKKMNVFERLFRGNRKKN